MIKLTQSQINQLLAHLPGEQLVIATTTPLLTCLRQAGLLRTMPAGAARPRRSALTPRGRHLAEQLIR